MLVVAIFSHKIIIIDHAGWDIRDHVAGSSDWDGCDGWLSLFFWFLLRRVRSEG